MRRTVAAGCSGVCAKRRAASPSAKPADAMPVARRNVRRCTALIIPSRAAAAQRFHFATVAFRGEPLLLGGLPRFRRASRFRTLRRVLKEGDEPRARGVAV